MQVPASDLLVWCLPEAKHRAVNRAGDDTFETACTPDSLTGHRKNRLSGLYIMQDAASGPAYSGQRVLRILLTNLIRGCSTISAHLQ